jgi:hypothetical protein
MKPRAGAADISRRVLLSAAAVLPFPSLLGTPPALAQDATTQLASWNDGPAKRAIIEFVRATTDRSSPKFVSPEERIATLDQDGTLWVEHPMYTFIIYCFERVPMLVKAKPGLKDVEPFKTVLSGNQDEIARLTTADLEKILTATLTGMTVEEFKAEAANWLETARHPRWNRPYTELVFRAKPIAGANGKVGWGCCMTFGSLRKSIVSSSRFSLGNSGTHLCVLHIARTPH